MKLLSREGKAKDVAKRWHEQYWDGRIGWRFGDDKRAIYESLVALGDNPTPSAVNEAVGNTSWTDVGCDECKASVDRAVQLGEEPGYGSSTAVVCFQCLALAIFETQ